MGSDRSQTTEADAGTFCPDCGGPLWLVDGTARCGRECGGQSAPTTTTDPLAAWAIEHEVLVRRIPEYIEDAQRESDLADDEFRSSDAIHHAGLVALLSKFQELVLPALELAYLEGHTDGE